MKKSFVILFFLIFGCKQKTTKIEIYIKNENIEDIYSEMNKKFDYGMDSRTLKSIRIKERIFSDNAKRVMLNSDIDSTKIATILYTGDVDFGKSTPRQKPCAEYYVTGNNDLKNVSLYVSRCDSVATIKEIIID